MRSKTIWKRTAAVLLSAGTFGICSAELAAASDFVATSGDVLLGAIPAIAVGSIVYKHDCEGGWQFAKGFLANQAVTQGLKYAVHKDRPDDSDDHSFPSGHTSTTFQAAAFIHKRYGWEYSIPAYIGAAYTGWTRIDSDKHYVEDVLAGAVIGTLSGLYFAEPYKDARLTPFASANSLGIILTMQW